MRRSLQHTSSVRVGNAEHEPHALAGGHALRALAPAQGHVLAVFERCLYLQSLKGCCCVIAPSLPLGPLHLKLPPQHADWHALTAVKVNQPWQWRNGWLIVDNVRCARLDAPRTWRAPRPLQLNHDALVLAQQQLERLSAQASAIVCASELGAMVPWQQPLQRFAGVLEHWITEGKSAYAPPATLRQCIGCGPGLTPSGDDLLIGAMVSLWAFGERSQAQALANWVRAEAPGRTNALSLAHLLGAADGVAIEPVMALLEHCASGDASATTDALRQLLAHGQHSGHDTLCGIRLTLKALSAPQATPNDTQHSAGAQATVHHETMS